MTGLGLAAGVGSMFLPGGQGIGAGLLGSALNMFGPHNVRGGLGDRDVPTYY